MPYLYTVKKGEEVLLSNGDIKVYGYEYVNRRMIRAVKRNHKWYILKDKRPLSHVLSFFNPFRR